MPKCFLTAAVTAALVAAPSAYADTFDFGDFNGDDVMFLDVVENTTTSSVALFGEPDVLGNSLDFDPTDFEVTTDDADADTLSSTVTTTVMANSDDFVIDTINLDETGSFTLAGLTGDATVAVFAVATIDVVEIDGMTAPTDLSFQQTFDFDPSDGTFSISDDGAGSMTFSGSTSLDIADFLDSQGISGDATKVELSFTNTLSAASVDGTSAFIEKDDIGGMVVTVIPEPATAGLLGVAGLALLRRRA